MHVNGEIGAHYSERSNIETACWMKIAVYDPIYPTLTMEL